MPTDSVSRPSNGITLSKEECALRYTLVRLDSFSAKDEQDKAACRGQAHFFHMMGRFSRSEIAEMRNKAMALFNARTPAAHEIH
jgi:hypothetical protein